jgi:hypothetical protein
MVSNFLSEEKLFDWRFVNIITECLNRGVNPSFEKSECLTVGRDKWSADRM